MFYVLSEKLQKKKLEKMEKIDHKSIGISQVSREASAEVTASDTISASGRRAGYESARKTRLDADHNKHR